MMATTTGPAEPGKRRLRAEGAPLLSVEDLTVGFPTEDGVVNAVRGVSYTLSEREVLGIVGESGSGKSVSSMAVMGLLPRSARVSGRITFDGRDILTMRGSEQRALRGQRIAMIFQDPMTALNPVYSVGDQLAEAVRSHEVVAKKIALARAVEMLDLVGIPQPKERLGAYPHEFSGGMRQRVMIAMAVINNPDIIIADEPTTALDVTVQAQILEKLIEVKDAVQRRDRADHPRPRRGGRDGQPGAGDVRRARCRARRHRGGLRLPADALHGRAAGLDPVLASDGGRLRPIPGAPPSLINLPHGLPVLPALPAGQPKLPHRGAGAGGHRPAGHTGRLPPLGPVAGAPRPDGVLPPLESDGAHEPGDAAPNRRSGGSEQVSEQGGGAPAGRRATW